MDMVVARIFAPGNRGQSIRVSLVHSLIISNIGPESDMVPCVRSVRKRKAAELII